MTYAGYNTGYERGWKACIKEIKEALKLVDKELLDLSDFENCMRELITEKIKYD